MAAGTGGLRTRSTHLRVGARLVALVVLTMSVSSVFVAAPSTDPASAEGWGTIEGGVPEAIVIVSDERTIVRWEASGRGGPRWVCGYHPIVAPVHSVLDPTPVVEWTTRVDPEVGTAYMLGCFVDDDDGGRTLVRSRYVIFDREDIFSGIAATERALDEARRRLDIPDPDPAINPAGEQLVGLPMWMWLDRPWDRISAVASVGETWAAVAAYPIIARWRFADGSDIWCDRGIAYDIWRSPRDQWSGCTHTFQRSSIFSYEGVEWVEVTMTWEVEWYAADIGGQPLGTVQRTTAFPVRVVEAQAVIR